MSGILASDIPAVGELLESHEGRAGANGVIGAAMHELQQLHRELDVAQATGSELHLTRGGVGTKRRLDAATHRLHVLNEPGALPSRPHERREGLDVVLPEREVTSNRSRL